jgi:sarcosine/dimethylglycine N-methyltransferase
MYVSSVLKLPPGSSVLDVGSGYGGPARYLAERGISVTAMDFQEECHHFATRLTERCGLNHLVQHVCADFMNVSSHLSLVFISQHLLCV